MTTNSRPQTFGQGRGGAMVRAAAVVLFSSTFLGVPAVDGSGAGVPTLRSVNETGFTGALATSSSRSLYLLTSEKGAALKCTGACLLTWLPMLVKNSVVRVTLGTGVKGSIGFVARGAAMKQVTYDSYPLYSFAGDSGPRQHAGEGLAFTKGVWFLVKANATTSNKAPLRPISITTTTTTLWSTTTSTSSGSSATTTTTRPPMTTTTSMGGVVY